MVAGHWAKIVCVFLGGFDGPTEMFHDVVSWVWIDSRQARPCSFLMEMSLLIYEFKNNVVSFSALGGQNGTKFSISPEWHEHLD